MNFIKNWKLYILISFVLLGSCRNDPRMTSTETVNRFGDPGTGYTVQCSGWYPDWISNNPPSDAVNSFQLSQGYSRGTPVFSDTDPVEIIRWDPPEPLTTVARAPWLAHDFRVPSQREAYINSLIDYAYSQLRDVDFDANKPRIRKWFHVPMMTTSPTKRREPYHGVTKERPLRASDHSWITSGELDSFAIGYYNSLGGYTLGQVFNHPNPQLADASAAQFIEGAFVFKLLFAEYDTSKINAAQNPLIDSPEWEIQDIQSSASPLKKVRLIQIDVAVKDSRATQTGWVFGTFVYDKNSSESDPWKKLAAIGLQWGNDPTVSSTSTSTLAETWISSSIPALFQGQLGRAGRLNGPVDNPRSSCLSCHSTAQVVAGKKNSSGHGISEFTGASLLPPSSCSNSQDMIWFRNLLGSQPFGVMSNNGAGCSAAIPTVATPPLFSLDYSLQLKDGLISSLFYENSNPCAHLVEEREFEMFTQDKTESSNQRKIINIKSSSLKREYIEVRINEAEEHEQR